MNSMSEVVVVMVHLYEDMPDAGPNVLWKEHPDVLAKKAKELKWPVIYQFDFVDRECYNQLLNEHTRLSTRKLGGRWQPIFDKMLPNSNVELKSVDLISTSNAETAMFIDQVNPGIVLFGGLHKDRCVEAAKKDIQTTHREYLVSDLLSYTWKDTWQDG
jgi:hypothetical protein